MNITPGTKCTVHMNLHRQRRGLADCWSVTVAGKVVGYTANATLRNATPKVSLATHRRIVEKGSREVYARIQGEWMPPALPRCAHLLSFEHGDVIRLNPFRQPEFTHRCGKVYTGSPYATFGEGGGFIAH